MNFSQFSAIAVAGALLFGSIPAFADDTLASIHYIVGQWPYGRYLDMNVDVLTGKITQTRFAHGNCVMCADNQGIASSRQLTSDEAKSLTVKTEIVWIAGSSPRGCRPDGHAHMILTIVRGGETKKNIHITPQCITAEGKTLIEFLEHLSKVQ